MSKNHFTLTHERLRELLNYDPETGIFTRSVGRANQVAGAPAGRLAHHGYLFVTIDYKKYLAHRLAWYFIYGEWPTNNIDHINGVRGDNRISNLRDVSQAFNVQNRRQSSEASDSGVLGVYQKRDKWAAVIWHSGKSHYIGSYLTPESAHEAYLMAKRAHHPGCTI